MALSAQPSVVLRLRVACASRCRIGSARCVSDIRAGSCGSRCAATEAQTRRVATTIEQRRDRNLAAWRHAVDLNELIADFYATARLSREDPRLARHAFELLHYEMQPQGAGLIRVLNECRGEADADSVHAARYLELEFVERGHLEGRDPRDVSRLVGGRRGSLAGCSQPCTIGIVISVIMDQICRGVLPPSGWRRARTGAWDQCPEA